MKFKPSMSFGSVDFMNNEWVDLGTDSSVISYFSYSQEYRISQQGLLIALNRKRILANKYKQNRTPIRGKKTPQR